VALAVVLCLISDTLAALTFSNLAVSRKPRPSSHAREMRCTVNGIVLGRPTSTSAGLPQYFSSFISSERCRNSFA
jgi:hypothetical protein